MRHLALGLSLLAVLAACACAETAPQGNTAATAAVTAPRTPSPLERSPTPSTSTATAIREPPTTTPPSLTASVAPTHDQQARVTRVVDGDTIEVQMAGATYRVRYIGVDTPETVDPRTDVQCYGREASERNRQLVEGKTVELEKDVSETDKYDRLLRYVWIDGEMANATLVREGYAMAISYPPDLKYQDLFLSLQQQAREAGLGLWGPICIPTPVAPGICDYSGTDEPVIKGNVSQSTGERIYHVPAGEFYDKTVIDESADEHWFCTEQEAVAAGWRKSKR